MAGDALDGAVGVVVVGAMVAGSTDAASMADAVSPADVEWQAAAALRADAEWHAGRLVESAVARFAVAAVDFTVGPFPTVEVGSTAAVGDMVVDTGKFRPAAQS
jgi:hypothetical protein